MAESISPLDEITDILTELIAIPSTAANPADIRRCADWIGDWLLGNKIVHRRLDHDGTPSILVLPQTDRAPVLIMTHFDVVDGPDHLFHPRVADGCLYGRGAIDDKYAVALSLVLFKWFSAHCNDPAEIPFGLLMTGDEETGGRNGAARALAGLDIDFAIAVDGGRLDRVVVKEKGVIRLRLRATGVSAHGARPWLGKSAIDQLVDDITVLRGLFPKESEAPHWHRTLNVGRIRGGDAVNRVPDRAEAWLDIRFTEDDNPDELIADIGSCIRSEITVDTKDALFFAGKSPHLDRLLAMFPGMQTQAAHGASDARFLSDHNIPGIVWGANGDRSQHTAEEHVHLESVAALYRRLEKYFLSVLGG